MNEAVFFFATFVTLSIVLIAWRLGREWLYLAIMLNICLSFFLWQKFFMFFGLTVSMGSITYMAIYTGADILTEHEGKAAGYKVPIISCITVIILAFMQQLTLIPPPIEDGQTAHDAMVNLFETGPRIVIAWITAYFVGQRIDVWIYSIMKRKLGGKRLWLRNNVSTAMASFFDVAIFCLIAFSFIMPWDTLVQIFIGSYVLCIISALLDTPVMYLSYLVKGKKLSEIKT